MFDKLIECNSEAAEFNNRRSYFMVSSIIVGALFLAAVVASIYAGDIGLGQDEFEISTMLPPVIPDTQPEPPRPQTQTREPQQTAELPSRQTNMARIDEYQFVPTNVSVARNTEVSRPYERFKIGLINSDPDPGVATGRERSGNGDSSENGLTNGSSATEDRDAPAPPPAVKPEVPKRPISIGVANGRAINLPKPPYPPAALAVNAQGKVDVQVTIDENGKVVAAKAVSGHSLLRPAAERVAWSAKFTPTTLSKVPVKVTGVIVYNFTRN